MGNPEATIVLKMMELVKLANIHLNHFPKYEKYGLSQEIRQTMYEVYKMIIESQKRYHKKTSLSNLDIAHEQLRMLVRLAFELKYFEYHNGKAQRGEMEYTRRYLALNGLIDEVGAMIGGWIRSERTEEKNTQHRGSY